MISKEPFRKYIVFVFFNGLSGVLSAQTPFAKLDHRKRKTLLCIFNDLLSEK